MGNNSLDHNKQSVQPALASMPGRPVAPGLETVVSRLRKLARGLQPKLSFKSDSRTPIFADPRLDNDGGIAVQSRASPVAQGRPVEIDGFLDVIGRKTGDAS